MKPSNGDVLLIEDDKALNRFLVQHLRERGFKARGVFTWSEANDYLEEMMSDKELNDAHKLASDIMDNI